MSEFEKATIQERWESYLNEVVDKEAGPAQINETRMAFYAGAVAMFSIQLKVATYDENIGVAMLRGLSDELDRYADEISKS